MATEVIKRDGSKQPFDAEKIRNAVKSAAQEAGLDEERTAETVVRASTSVIEWAEGKEEVATSEIRERLLTILDDIAPEAAEGWRKHDKQKGRS